MNLKNIVNSIVLYIRRLLPSGPKPTERSTDTIVQFWNDYRFLFHRVLNVVFDENKPKLICSLFQYSNSDVIQKPLILLCQTEAIHKANTKFSVAIHKNCHSLYTLSYYKFVCLFVCFTIKVLHAANLLLLMVQQSSIHCSKINTTVEAWYCLVAKKVSILSGCL